MCFVKLDYAEMGELALLTSASLFPKMHLEKKKGTQDTRAAWKTPKATTELTIFFHPYSGRLAVATVNSLIASFAVFLESATIVMSKYSTHHDSIK